MPRKKQTPDTSTRKDETIIRRLPCKLTPLEYEEKSAQLAQKQVEIVKREEDRKADAKEAKGEIDKLKGEVNALAAVLHTRQEDRDVECHEVIDWEEGRVRILRSDTMDQVDSRPIDPEDKQTSMSLPSSASSH